MSRDPHSFQLPFGVLALQGSFRLHQQALTRLGIATRRVTRAEHLQGLAALILPGGESTTMAHLAREYRLFDPLRAAAKAGLPMFGTCAGAILLGRGAGFPPQLEVAPVTIERNAYGRQIDSFTAELTIDDLAETFHGVFIRAPIMQLPQDDATRALCWHDGHPVLARYRHMLLATFHPELTDDLRIHRLFLEIASEPAEKE